MNILTFDIEEWFHLLDNDSTKTEKEWSNYECRIHANVDRILAILDNHKTKATFFCLSWIAEKYPEIVKKINGLGYEIASHSSNHQLIYEQTPQQFKEDLIRSLGVLQNITGKKVNTYRAPGFSLIESCKWAFEIMAENGIENDSSVFPASRIHGGFESFPQAIPSVIHYQGYKIKEFPINTINLFGKKLVFSGGGYFRLFPYTFIKRWTDNSHYLMSYLHPRDFDSTQPVISELPLSRKFRSYVGLKKSVSKLNLWLSDFEFIDIDTAIREIDWDKAPLIKLN